VALLLNISLYPAQSKKYPPQRAQFSSRTTLLGKMFKNNAWAEIKGQTAAAALLEKEKPTLKEQGLPWTVWTANTIPIGGGKDKV